MPLGLALAFSLSGLQLPDQDVKTLEFPARMSAPAALLREGLPLDAWQSFRKIGCPLGMPQPELVSWVGVAGSRQPEESKMLPVEPGVSDRTC